MPRCVTGIPAYAGTATALVTPGTTTNGMPASRQAMASSPPRPNTNGSPPLSRTTIKPLLRPVDDQRVDLGLIQPVLLRLLARVDQFGVGAGFAQQFRRREPVVDHHVGAAQQRPSPLTVIKPGSPGPAPTR